MKTNYPASSTRYSLPVMVILFLISQVTQGQDARYKERQQHRDTIVIASVQGNFSLSFKGKDILETRFSKDADGGDSLVVHMGNGDLKLKSSEGAGSRSLSFDGIEILIQKEPFGITYNFQQIWMDFSNGRKHLPGSSVRVSGKDDIIPVLVRSGAIFPVVEEEKYGAPNKHLVLHHVFSSEVRKKQKGTCNSQVPGNYCYDIQIEAGNSLDIKISRKNLPLDEREEEAALEEVDFVVHAVHRTVAFIWVNGIKYTGKNFMHQGKLIVPLNFREDRAELKIDWE